MFYALQLGHLIYYEFSSFTFLAGTFGLFSTVTKSLKISL